jgi:flagellar hook-associated protein 2
MGDRMRIGGLASGMDTDAAVKNMMKAEQMKLDKLEAERTVREWTQDQYRDINKSIVEFKDKYFDVLNKDTYIKSPAMFSSTKATISDDYKNIIKVTNTQNIAARTRFITVKQKAFNARKESSGTISSSYSKLESTKDVDRSKLKEGFEFGAVVDGIFKSIKLDEDLSSATNKEIEDKFQNLLKEAFGDYETDNPSGSGKVKNPKIKVEFKNNRFSFELGGPLKSSQLELRNPVSTYNEKMEMVDGEKNFTEGTKELTDFNGVFKIQEGSGSFKTITVSGANDAQEMLDKINEQLKTHYSNRVKASMSGNKLQISAMGVGEKFKLVNDTSDDLLAKAGIASGTEIQAVKGRANFGYNDVNQKLEFKIDGKDYEVNFDKNFNSNEKNEMETAINSALSGSGVSVTIGNDGTIAFNSPDGHSIEVVGNNELENLGMERSSISNRIDLKSSIKEVYDANLFENSDVNKPFNDEGEIEFKINGQTFQFTSADSIDDITAKINQSNVGVKMEYDQYRDQFVLESKSMGTASRVKIEDQKGNFMKALGLDETEMRGQDAIVNIDNTDDGVDNGIDIYKSSNSFNIDGIGYELKSAEPGKKIEVTVESDVDTAYDNIKAFVEDYNKLIKQVNDKLNEERYRDYKPLTSEQKQSMSDDDAELWTEKAKSGLLRNDSTLSSFVDGLRLDLYSKVGGISLPDIGITTSSDYKEKGKLVINPTKLKMALKEKGSEIVDLFTMDEEGSKGIAYKLEEQVNKMSGRTGTKGKLLQKAGMIGDRTQYDNVLYKEIKEYDKRIKEMIKRMADKEERYYNQFSKLEVAMQKMNQQSTWLAQQLGGM